MRWLIVIAAAWLSTHAPAALAGARVQSSNFSYLGTISIPATDASCIDNPNARTPGFAYNPAGNGGAGSFYLSHRRKWECAGEISKPAVGGTATFLQPYQPILGNIDAIQPADCPTNGCYIGGLFVYGGNLYVTAYPYYNEQATYSIWRRSLTLSSTAGRVGPFESAVAGNQRMANSYMAAVPAAFQSMLGGPAVIGGCCWNVINGTSLGPALYSFDPANLGSGYALVQYPSGHQTLNYWDAPGSHPEANPTTRIAGVTFVDGTDSVLFFGNTGAGEICYGPACNDPDLPGVQGTHAYPYLHYVWAYDVDDLAAVKAGTLNPWDVFPYAMWSLPDMGSAAWWDENSINGAAFVPPDKLYILKSREMDGTANPQIHVYQITGLGGGSNPASGSAQGVATPAGNAKIRLPAPSTLNRVPK